MRGVPLAVVGAAMLVAGCTTTATSITSVVATGRIRCTTVSGSVRFSPPLTASGHSLETVVVTADLSGCSPTASNVGQVAAGTATLRIPVDTSACAGLLQFPTSAGGVSAPASSQALTIRATWTSGAFGHSVAPSVLRFSGFAATVNQAGDVGFAFPGQGHQAVMSGSFAGADHGALSTASVETGEQAGQILDSCSGPSGLASIAIDDGQVTFG